MLSLAYENPWTTIFFVIVISAALTSIIGAIRGQ